MMTTSELFSMPVGFHFSCKGTRDIVNLIAKPKFCVCGSEQLLEGEKEGFGN